MTSEAKRLANRRNAERSTGPRTTVGKRRVSQNALRHGFSRTIASNTFVTEETGRLVESIVASFDKTAKADLSEFALAASQAQVRLNQITQVQLDLYNGLSKACEEENSSSAFGILRQLSRLDRYIAVAWGQRRKALHGLTRLQVFGRQPA